MTSISITLRDKNAKRLSVHAKQLDRSRSWIVNEAVESYLAHQAWMDQETQAALDAIDDGAKLVPHEQVMERFQARISAIGKSSSK